MAVPNRLGPPARQMTRASVLRYLLIAVGYLLLFLVLDKATWVFETSPGISPWYPPPGLSLALLLICGLAYLPLLLLASLCAITLSPCCRSTPLVWLSLPLSITFGYGLTALILRRILPIDPNLHRLQDMVRLTIGVLVAPLLIGLCAVSSFAEAGIIPWSTYINAVLEFWVGDAIGIVILTPFLLIHVAPRLKIWLDALLVRPLATTKKKKAPIAKRWSTRAILELAGQGLAIVLALWGAFGIEQANEFHLLYLCFLPLIWIALRYGLPGATIGIPIMNLGVILTVQHASYVLPNMAGLQLFMLALSLTGLLLGVVVSENRQTTSVLRQTEARTRALLNALPDMMFRLDRTGVFRDFHAQGDDLLVMAPETIMGVRLEQTPLPPTLIEQIKQATSATLAGAGVQSFEYSLALPGGVHDFEARIVASGPEEVVAIVRNITARKQAEAELIDERNRLRTLLDILPDYIFIKDRQGHFVLINAAYAQFLGAATAEAVIGKTVFDFYPPEMAEQYNADDRLVLDSGQSLPDHEEASVNRAGDYQIHLVTKVPLCTSQGEVVGLVGRGHDITARKQAEARNVQLLQEIDQQRSHLRAMNKRLAELQEDERKALARELHDEIGQNLSLLAINLKILQTQIVTGVAANDAAQARLKESLLLVQQITEHIRNVMADLRPPVLDDYGLFAALEWYAARVAAQTELAIYVQGQELKPRPSVAIEHALFRITQEALTNVVKHAQATQVQITLRRIDGAIRLEIQDNGRGIDAALLDNPAAQQTWGLLNMRERAEAVGGHLYIQSSDDQGASVIVEIASEALKT